MCLTAITPDLDTIKAMLQKYDNTDIIRSVLWVGQVIGHENKESLEQIVEDDTLAYDNINLINNLKEGPKLKKQKDNLKNGIKQVPVIQEYNNLAFQYYTDANKQLRLLSASNSETGGDCITEMTSSLLKDIT